MNSGIIMIGLALVLLSAAMVVSPSGAASPDTSCSPGCGSVIFSGSSGVGQDSEGIEGIGGESVPAFTAATGPVSAP
ncbi:MAG: hypothetical protein PHT99_05185 [Methanoregula sp.]|nr:hypothetical protein [Methanoregula sp.]